jgi:hypothetical protein
MALAMIYPEPGSRTKKDAAKAAESSGFSKKRLSEARSVLRESRDLAKSVVKGSISLDDALKQVEEARQQANSTEAKLARLRLVPSDYLKHVPVEYLNVSTYLIRCM